MIKIKVLLVLAWVSCISTAIGYMHSWHMADFTPEKLDLSKLSKYIPDVKNYGAIHFLTPTCSCSTNIFKHILKRKLKTTKELVVLIDDHKSLFSRALKDTAHSFISLSTKELSKDFAEQVKGVPLLVIYDKNKEVKYVGGYSSKSITPFTKINIKSFVDSLSEGRKIASKPVLGCAVSKEYKKLLDPFGLKYKEV